MANNPMKISRARFTIALPLLIAACSTVPITGRRALSIVPDSEVTTLSVDQYQQLISQSKLSNNPQDVEMVRRVGQRIAAVSGHPEYKWEYNLIDEPKTVNAFCMPGGKVAFYTGILPVTQTDAGVAVVMGHEVAHAIAQHGGGSLLQGLVGQRRPHGPHPPPQKKTPENPQITNAAG